MAKESGFNESEFHRVSESDRESSKLDPMRQFQSNTDETVT